MLVGGILMTMQDSPGDNPGDNAMLGVWGGILIGFSICYAFGTCMYRSCELDSDPGSWAGRKRRAIEGRGARRGKRTVVAIPDGEYVEICERTPVRHHPVPNLWPLSYPWMESRYRGRGERFHAERGSEAAMDYYNELEARIENEGELSNGAMEARALAAVLNKN